MEEIISFTLLVMIIMFLILSLFNLIQGTECIIIPHGCKNPHGIKATKDDEIDINDAVDLVLYAFENGEQGDLFVQKAPAATIETLAKAVLELKNSNVGYTVIGTRHGEKLYETFKLFSEIPKCFAVSK